MEPEGQPLSTAESALVRWMLQHGEAGATTFLSTVDALRVVARCSCGCASIDFTADKSGPMTIVADFGIKQADGVPGGVFLFARGGKLAGLDVHSFGKPIAKLPEPVALVPLPLA
jgi:hypothetical protein